MINIEIIIQIIYYSLVLTSWFYFGLGILEAIIAMFFYKFAQRNFDGACSIADWFRGIIWLTVVCTLASDIHTNKPLGFYYITGMSVGTYLGLKIETRIEKYIFKLKNRGRRKKRWYLQCERKE